MKQTKEQYVLSLEETLNEAKKELNIKEQELDWITTQRYLKNTISPEMFERMNLSISQKIALIRGLINHAQRELDLYQQA
ncbi:MAG TPA: hypothetical protein DCY20_02810 [Firmicutes bacterium]|nr:hypothetical protein [Bacillota bacterium]